MKEATGKTIKICGLTRDLIDDLMEDWDGNILSFENADTFDKYRKLKNFRDGTIATAQRLIRAGNKDISEAALKILVYTYVMYCHATHNYLGMTIRYVIENDREMTQISFVRLGEEDAVIIRLPSCDFFVDMSNLHF